MPSHIHSMVNQLCVIRAHLTDNNMTEEPGVMKGKSHYKNPLNKSLDKIKSCVLKLP